ncbi:DUF1405 domain-containing protein [Thalassorhabdus alkalitolerans]|uniref:DUF1405 domain-containing protein n=1 Tax=Thalassorhabdus alkalitolerans TaxID=2282697 RepID=A0ABW0YP16_9BACI
MSKLLYWLASPFMLAVLLIINILGTIYGYWWYKDQLAITPTHFLVFVPDSPTASLFFCFVLALFLFRKNNGLIEALAAVTLVKYGIWAVVMNIVPGFMGAELGWQNYLLIASHLGMAIQGLLFAPFYRIKVWHLAVVSVWTLHNDVIDYIYGMHPWVSGLLTDHIHHVAYFTFWLSIGSIWIVYVTGVRSERKKLQLP